MVLAGLEASRRIPPNVVAAVKDFLYPDEDESAAEERERTETELSTVTISTSSSLSDGEEGVGQWSDWGQQSTFVPDALSEKTEAEAEGSMPWPQSCLLASIPSGDVIVFAADDRVVVLEARLLPSSSEPNVYTKSHNAALANDEKSYRISGEFTISSPATALTCLPIGTSRRTETQTHDWVCVVVGNENGEVNFFTSQGVLLLKQQFSRKQVLSFHLNTVLHGSQEFSVLYSDCLVAVDGLSLYTSLRGCRSQAARSHGIVEDLGEYLNLSFHKWDLEEMRGAAEHVCAGPIRLNRFDQLEAASNLGGPGSRPSTALPHYSTYLLTGSSAFAGFYWVEEGSSKPALTDAIFNFAGKVKNSMASQLLGLAWGGGSREQKNTNPADVRPSRLKARNFLMDPARQGERVFLAPFGGLAAVTDAQARVFLIDVNLREILRVWKGYRDADIGWVEAKGEAAGPKKGGRSFRARVLFLIIFAPRRGLLEVWTMSNGPRVGAFNVDKRGRLITAASQKQLGGNFNDLAGDDGESILFLRSDGTVSSLRVDFHAAVQDESTSLVHDNHVLRKFKTAFTKGCRTANPDKGGSEALKSMLTEFKTATFLQNAVEFAMFDLEGPSVTALATLADHCLSVMKSKAGMEGTFQSPEGIILKGRILAYNQLLNLYAKLEKEPSIVEDRMETEDVESLLYLSESELRDALRRLNAHSLAHPVEGEAPKFPAVQNFLRYFDYSSCASAAAEHDPSVKKGDDCGFVPLRLRPDLKDEDVKVLGHMLFRPFLVGTMTLSELQQQILPPTGLSFGSLLSVLCDYWLGAPHDYSVYPPLLLELFKFLVADLDHTSWGPAVEMKLRESRNMREAFTLCLIVRAAHRGWQEPAVVDAERGSWEKVEATQGKWDVVLNHFSALLTLSSLQKPPESCSFDELMSSGRGYYVEKLGRILSLSSALPNELANWFSVDNTESPLADLRSQLPLSLCKDLAMAEAAWELGSQWNKGPEEEENRALFRSLEFLRQIDHPHLQYGITFLLWETFLGGKFKGLCFLMEKVGKFPKDRQLRKEVGVGERGVESFAGACSALLALLIESNRHHEYTPALPFRYEDFLDNLFTGSSIGHPANCTRDSLPERAARLKPANFFLLSLHWHMALVMKFLLANRSVRPARPFSYFDYKGKRALFTDLNSYPLISLSEVDAQTKGTRQRLCAAAITEIISSSGGEERTERTAEVYLLADDWELEKALTAHAETFPDISEMRREEVVGLYKAGEDALAERKLAVLGERGRVGEELLILTGVSLAARMELRKSDADTQELLSLMSNKTRNWITSLPSLEVDKGLSEDPTRLKKLLRNALSAMQPNDAKADIASELDRLL